jgi:hypothetical protein
MANNYEKAKTMAPTRPHPAAPAKPPFGTVAQGMSLRCFVACPLTPHSLPLIVVCPVLSAPIDALKDVARSVTQGVTTADVASGGITSKAAGTPNPADLSKDTRDNNKK